MLITFTYFFERKRLDLTQSKLDFKKIETHWINFPFACVMVKFAFPADFFYSIRSRKR